MKKIITLFVALFAVATMATAQTVERNGVFSNMYLGINGGASYSTVNTLPDFTFDALNYNAAIELGKNVTPVTGFSLEGIAKPDFTDGFTMQGVDVFGNTKFNFMNLFGGYKGYPRRVEVLMVTGIGWNHSFDKESVNPNDIALQAGLEFDFNLGKERNWYITFRPMVQANEILKSNEITYMAKGADLKANIGIAYRFGSKNTDSHNFVICPYTYTEDEYAELYQMYDDCMSRPATVDTVVVEKVVENTVEIGNVTECVTFAKDSDVITDVEIQRIDLYTHSMNKDASYVVCGSADSGTGTEAHNKDLAQRRADAVVKALKERGFDNVETVVKLDALDVTELSRCAIITKK